MLRGMYAGVSGLRTHQLKMDVIGNNIANVNTVGYKRSTATFKEVFSQTLQGASGPQGGMAGTNPQQVGLGVTQGSVSTIHTQGAAQTTDNPLDVMIDGNSFFTVSNDPGFLNRFYTRAGNFQIDEQGTLATPDGYKVLGYKMNDDGTVSQEPGELIVNKADTMEPTTTKNIEMIGNLNSSSAANAVRYMDTRVYDSLGNSYTVKFEMRKTGENAWTSGVTSIADANGKQLYSAEYDGTKYILKDIDTSTPAVDGHEITLTGTGVTDGALTQALTFNVSGGLNPIVVGPPSSSKIDISFAKNGNGVEFGTAGKIAIDFSKITQYGTDFTIEARRKDGNTAGNVDSFAISDKGELTARYTNGESKVLGIIALAKFENNAGLQKMGGNLYQNTRNSGDPVLGRAAQQGYGVMAPGRLEMSNVDLSYEFTEMITTQRGFQSNSRIITTSDEMLQELINLKR